MLRLISLAVIVLLISSCADEGATTNGPDLASTADAARSQLAAVNRAQTATAVAISRAATAEAKATRSAIEAANTRATVEAKQTAQARDNATATMQAYAFSLTATADALALAQQKAAATSTADAQLLAQAQRIQAATATAQAVDLSTQAANDEAQRNRRTADFFSYVWPTILIFATVAALIFALVAINRWIDAFAMQRAVIETRTGTVFFVRDGRSFSPKLLSQPTIEGHIAHTIDLEPTIPVNTAHGTTYIAKNGNGQSVPAGKRLTMRLLRNAMQHAGTQADYIPSADVLGWPDDSRNRAVALLKPHVSARVGKPRKGEKGTILAGEYRTLHQLYLAVRDEQIGLAPLP
jgi:hypothetical protein